MKIKIEGYTGPNTVIGNGGKVRARLAVNAAHPAVGQEVEVDEAETGKPSEAEVATLANLKVSAKAELSAEHDAEAKEKKAKADAEALAKFNAKR